MDFFAPVWGMVKGCGPWLVGVLVIRCLVEFFKRVRKGSRVIVFFCASSVCFAEFGAGDSANLNSASDDLRALLTGAPALYSIAAESDRTATLLGEAVAQTEAAQMGAHGVYILIGVLLAFPLQMALMKRTV